MTIRRGFGAVILVALVVWASPVHSGSASPSLNQLFQGLQSLVESADHLVAVNNALTLRTRLIQERVNSLRNHSEALEKNNGLLKDQLAVYEDKTKGKEGALKQNLSKVDDEKTRLLKLDQEIEMKKITLAQRQKQQEYVFKLLAIINNGGTFEQNVQAVRKTQELLARQLDDGQHRVADLEAQWKEISFWYGNPSLTITQLTETRDQLKKKLTDINRLGVSEKLEAAKIKIKTINNTIINLNKVHSSYLKTLEVIEKHYSGSDTSLQAREDEKKLQQTLGRLKKDNKFLQKQVADLRFEMIDMDKKKSALEALLSQNKLP